MSPSTTIIEDLKERYGLYEVREQSAVNPEFTPANLIDTFIDPDEVKVHTNQNQTVWLLVSSRERRFLLQAPLT
jgi:hypothetical protein